MCWQNTQLARQPSTSFKLIRFSKILVTWTYKNIYGYLLGRGQKFCLTYKQLQNSSYKATINEIFLFYRPKEIFEQWRVVLSIKNNKHVGYQQPWTCDNSNVQPQKSCQWRSGARRPLQRSETAANQNHGPHNNSL